jgi:hypothetical protein
MPKAPTMLMTLQNLTHYVRTAFGNSNTRYGGANQDPPMQEGLRQDNGDGSSSWIAISIPLIEMVLTVGFRFFDWMTISNKRVEFVCY